MKTTSDLCRFIPVLGLTTLATLTATAQTTPGANWPTFNGPLRGTRFSLLSEITTANVRGLRPVARFDTGVVSSFQTGPVVIDGTMYLTTFKHTYAIDATSGAMKWMHVLPIKKTPSNSHRGVAYEGGRVFRGASDGFVYALDAATGRQLWKTKIADAKKGESIPMAPIASNGLVFVGNAGGDMFGVTGRVYALDTATGKQAWRFDMIPKTGPAAATWERKSATNPPTGGATWTTYSLDPASQVLYAATGNPAPDFSAAMHPGENLYATSLVALDARSGRLLAYKQVTPDDFHDWDVAAAPALITTRGGRQLAATGGKDGFLHGIDVSTINRAVADGALNRPQPSDKYGAAGRGGMKTRYSTVVTRRFNTRTPLSSKRLTRFAPGTQGGVEWNGPAFYAPLNLVLVPAIDWASSIRLAPNANDFRGTPGKPWTGSDNNGFGRQDPKSKWGGYLTALDADSGKVRWRYRAATPVVGAVTTTAGGLVFAGDLNGDVRAIDVSTGRVLWRHHGGKPIGGGIVSYQVDGRQYIAVADGMSAAIWPTKPTPARVVIYRLP